MRHYSLHRRPRNPKPNSGIRSDSILDRRTMGGPPGNAIIVHRSRSELRSTGFSFRVSTKTRWSHERYSTHARPTRTIQLLGLLEHIHAPHRRATPKHAQVMMSTTLHSTNVYIPPAKKEYCPTARTTLIHHCRVCEPAPETSATLEPCTHLASALRHARMPQIRNSSWLGGPAASAASSPMSGASGTVKEAIVAAAGSAVHAADTGEAPASAAVGIP